MRKFLGISTCAIAFLLTSLFHLQTEASYGDDVRFTNETTDEVVVTITGATSFFFRQSEEWTELGIKAPGFYSYPNKEYRLQPGQATPLIKQWRIRSVSARYGGYIGGKKATLGYSIHDNYIDFENNVWKKEGKTNVLIKKKKPTSYLGSLTGISMSLKFEYQFKPRSPYTNHSQQESTSSTSSTSSSSTNSQQQPNHSRYQQPAIPEELKKVYQSLGITTDRPTVYHVLAVAENAELDTIKKAYKNLALKWHPDKNTENTIHAQEVMKVINSAYDCILKEKQ